MLEESEWEEEEFENEEDIEEDYLGSDIENNMGVQNIPEKEDVVRKVLSDVDVLASEILTNRKLLAVFLELGERPKQAKELVSASVYVKAKVKDRYGDYEEKTIPKKLPQSTMYRLLKKLVSVGLAEAYKGIDYRKRYYKLTELGDKVLNKVLATIKESLKNHMDKVSDYYKAGLEEYEGYRVLEEKQFNKVVTKLFGVKPSLIIKLLNAVRKEAGYGERFILIDYGERKKRGFGF